MMQKSSLAAIAIAISASATRDVDGLKPHAWSPWSRQVAMLGEAEDAAGTRLRNNSRIVPLRERLQESSSDMLERPPSAVSLPPTETEQLRRAIEASLADMSAAGRMRNEPVDITELLKEAETTDAEQKIAKKSSEELSQIRTDTKIAQMMQAGLSLDAITRFMEAHRLVGTAPEHSAPAAAQPPSFLRSASAISPGGASRSPSRTPSPPSSRRLSFLGGGSRRDSRSHFSPAHRQRGGFTLLSRGQGTRGASRRFPIGHTVV